MLHHLLLIFSLIRTHKGKPQILVKWQKCVVLSMYVYRFSSVFTW